MATSAARKKVAPITDPGGKTVKKAPQAKATDKIKRPFQLTKVQRKHVDNEPVISEKMRYLRKEGLNRSQTASALGKIYQHVNNVWRGDDDKAAAAEKAAKA